MPSAPSALSGRNGRGAVLCGVALGVGAFAYLLAWPPTLNPADESFTLYGAKRVFQGQALYRDFFDFIAPGSFYVYALAYAVGGVSVTSARVMTALLNTASVVCTYALALHVASRAEALLAGLLVVAACVPVWNMASHHWVATAFGLATAAVLLADRWRESARARPAMAGLLAGVLVCSHQSRGAGVLVWLALVVPALAYGRGGAAPWRRVGRELWWTALGGAVACVAILGWTVWRASVAELVYATHTWVVTNYRSYHVGRARWAARGGFLSAGTAYTYWHLLRAEPVLLATEALLLAWTIGRSGLASAAPRLAVLLLAVLAVTSVLYYPDYIHVAFVTPFVLVVLAGLVYRARTALARLAPRAAAVALALVWVAATSAVAAKAWGNLERARAASPARFETAFGRLAGTPYQPMVIDELRQRLGTAGGRPPRLFAYPTDAWLYLTVPADNPTPFALLRPVYSTPEQIRLAQARLRADPDAAIVVNGVALRPDDSFVEWILAEYEDDAGIGPMAPNGFYAYRLFRPKRPAGAAP